MVTAEKLGGVATEELAAELVRRRWTFPVFHRFPCYEKWGYLVEEKRNKILTPGGTLDFMYITGEDGWVSFGTMNANTPDLELTLRLYSPYGKFEMVGTIRGLYANGLTQETAMGLWLSRYDTAHDIYVANLTPVWPGLPYRDRLEFYIRNTLSTQAMIRRIAVVRTEVE